MKDVVCVVTGAIGSAVTYLLGGWDASIVTLLLFMAIDYVTGIICAGVFHKSPKTDTGALESKAGLKGLCRKGMILLFVLIGVRLDIIIGASYIRDGVCIAFILNELISIVENAGLMGMPVPETIKNAIDILQKKGSDNNEN